MAKKRVGLDAGHGVDTFPPSKGVYFEGTGYAEHTYNAKVTQVIDRHLKRHGIETYMAQKPFGPDVPLNKRLQMYNNANLDLLWSTHANAGAASASGIGIFYWFNTRSGSDDIARAYIDEIKKMGLKLWGNGVFQSVPNTWSEFAICRDFAGPSVLAENGFMTNAADARLIFKSTDYIEKTGEASARAILRFFKMAWVPEKQPEKKPATVKPAGGAEEVVKDKLIVNNRQREEMARTYEFAYKKGIFSSNEHADKIRKDEMNVHEAAYLATVLTGAAMNGGKRIR